VQPKNHAGTTSSRRATRWHQRENRLAYFSGARSATLIKSLGVDANVVQELLRHASFKTAMDGCTQVLEEPKRQAREQLADLIMRTGKVGHAWSVLKVVGGTARTPLKP